MRMTTGSGEWVWFDGAESSGTPAYQGRVYPDMMSDWQTITLPFEQSIAHPDTLFPAIVRSDHLSETTHSDDLETWSMTAQPPAQTGAIRQIAWRILFMLIALVMLAAVLVFVVIPAIDLWLNPPPLPPLQPPVMA